MTPSDLFSKENKYNVSLPAIISLMEELCKDVVKCNNILKDSTMEWGSALYNLQYLFVKDLQNMKNTVDRSPHVDTKNQQILRGILLDINTLRMQALARVGVMIEQKAI